MNEKQILNDLVVIQGAEYDEAVEYIEARKW